MPENENVDLMAGLEMDLEPAPEPKPEPKTKPKTKPEPKPEPKPAPKRNKELDALMRGLERLLGRPQVTKLLREVAEMERKDEELKENRKLFKKGK